MLDVLRDGIFIAADFRSLRTCSCPSCKLREGRMIGSVVNEWTSGARGTRTLELKAMSAGSERVEE